MLILVLLANRNSVVSKLAFLEIYISSPVKSCNIWFFWWPYLTFDDRNKFIVQGSEKSFSWVSPGASIPSWGHDAFSSPVSDFPPIFDKFSDPLKICKNFYLFPKIFLIFIRQNFWWPFFSHRPQIYNFPLFSLFQYISPPVSQKLLFPPYFEKFAPLFSKNSPAFYILYVYFVSPHFDHDAFMHHPMHVLSVAW